MSSPRSPLPRPEAMHLQVARNIRNEIESGALRDGDVLPSTRELAEQWGVSVFTISEAMKLLAEEGLVISRSRSKRTVHSPNQGQREKIKLATPQLVLIGGYAGSGKTHLGRVLAKETGWPMLDKDTLTRPILEAAMEAIGASPNDRESETYLNLMRPREYEATMAAAHENVECGNSAIVTAPFLRELQDEAWISRTQADFAALKATTTVVWVYCDAATMHTYIRHRGAARDAAKLGDWAGYLKVVDLSFRPPVPHVLIDNSASSTPLQSQAADLVKAIVAGD